MLEEGRMPDKVLAVVEDPGLSAALDKYPGIVSVLRSDPQYNKAADATAAFMEAVASGFQVVVIMKTTQFLPWLYKVLDATRSGC